jgi:hypothetical protein
VRRIVVLLASLAFLAAGCGGNGAKQSHSVLDVSKAFYAAGLPFTTLVTSNPYVSGQVPFLPNALVKSDLRLDVQAQLSASETAEHTGIVVWVFDTDAHANQALKAVPLAGWGEGAQHATRKQSGNVIVVGSGFTGASKAKLDEALADLG